VSLPHGIDRSFFEEARARIAGRIVRTPMLHLEPGVVPEGGGVDEHGVVTAPSIDARLDRGVWLKLECAQVTGSFKPRGALNRILSLGPERTRRGVVTASGGNHGLAVAFAGRSLGIPTTVYLPDLTSEEKATRIARWGATVIRAGAVWDDAHAAALAHAERDGLAYVHPFADPEVVAGQGTLAFEIFEQAPETDALFVAIGGGGLIAGVGAAARLLKPGVRIIGVEPVGAPTLLESIRAGGVVELPAIHTKAGSLAPRRSDPYTFDVIREVVDEIVLVTDDEMRDAARFLFQAAHVAVELSGAAALAAFLNLEHGDRGAKRAKRPQRPCILVCGAGTDGAA
jgi:threonine dehydratase